MTSTFESYAMGRTIVLSRGLLDVLPDEASLAALLAHELGHIVLGHRMDTQFAFFDRIRFDEKNVRPMGRATRGMRGIDLRQDDYVVSICPVSAEDKERMLSVSEQGYGKQTAITTYRLQSRGGKGVINMKTTEKTGKVVAVFPVEDESEIMIITQQGKLIRIEAADIRKTGRSAQGVRLIKTDAGDKVTSASLVEAAAEEETEEVTE